ncbi:MAG: hypothetical protein JSV87_03810 [Candidatus Bathyarchaeota archaeon]|nr:MAG: hypothetical protein JSV87_03810 [Candidatus Bathyarchaeota archaeon]
MRKILLIPLMLCVIALLPTLWIPAVHANPPKTVSQRSDRSIPDPNMETRFTEDGNVIVHAWGGGGYFHGPTYGVLSGKWIHDEWQVVHLADGIVTINGVWDTPEGVTFYDDGAIYSGTIDARYWGTADMATGVFEGRWVVLSGTGDLANLRGGGAVWSDPAIDPLYLHGSFQYHFDPD